MTERHGTQWLERLPKSPPDATLTHLHGADASDGNDATDGEDWWELGFAGCDRGDRFGLGGDIGAILRSVVGIVSIGLAVGAGGLTVEGRN